jgi:hypothetical protein
MFCKSTPKFGCKLTRSGTQSFPYTILFLAFSTYLFDAFSNFGFIDVPDQVMVEMCVPDEGVWETDTVTPRVAKILKRTVDARDGKCSQVCGSICNHKPCTADMTIVGEVCKCIPNVTSKCGPNTKCVSDNTCECLPGYSGDPNSSAGCRLNIPVTSCNKFKKWIFGVGSKQLYIDMGTTSGTVAINYNFFSDPDELEVYYGTEKKLDTGLVVRKPNDPLSISFSGTSTILEFRILSSKDTSSWKIKAVHCPD